MSRFAPLFAGGVAPAPLERLPGWVCEDSSLLQSAVTVPVDLDDEYRVVGS
jgi:hypothetical protein